jgi:hypothetical protein
MIAVMVVFLFLGGLFAQSTSASPDHPWQFRRRTQIEDGAIHFRESRPSIEPERTYSLAELVDLAEGHSPETRVAWSNAGGTFSRRRIVRESDGLAMSSRNRCLSR